ncbi:MAG: hypothetical protein QOG64_2990, partial [Acidimicrobiaceae bacterium]|nr:hypothetical protein [Acidimicrobiaceae bacterium]
MPAAHDREKKDHQGSEASGDVERADTQAPGGGSGVVGIALRLQRTAGNRATAAFLAAAQTKLDVGPSDDPAEREADAIAAEVVERLRAHGASQSVDAGSEVEIGLGQTVRRQPASSSIGADGGTLDAATEAAVDAARSGAAGGGRPLDDPVRRSMEGAFGVGFGDVRVHSGTESKALNERLQAKAFTVGRDIFFRSGVPDGGTSAGQELLAHELTHVVQQSSRASRKIQRRGEYAGLNPFQQKTIDVQAEQVYDQKTRDFESGMGPVISESSAAHEAVNELLLKVKKVVDAWAVSTGQQQAAAYASEFQFAGGDKYYGAFEMSAANIKKIFDDYKDRPLRSKLKVVYNAVRNNNLVKWLKVAAIEMDAAAMGVPAGPVALQETAADVTKDAAGTIVPASVQAPTNVAVAPGFAANSGLSKTFANPQLSANVANLAAREEMIFAPNTFSGVMNMASGLAADNASRVGGMGAGLAEVEQRTLSAGDVTDLTSMEIRHIHQRLNLPVPELKGLGAKKKARDKLKDAPVPWEQGGEYYEVIPNSTVAKQAVDVRARLEAGTSGSTDLMLHGAQWLGLDVKQMYQLRLALIGWMLSNRDHSLFEILRSAGNYGLAYHYDPADIGSEYEDRTNFQPMDPSKFAKILPERKTPKWFLSTDHKDQLAAAASKAPMKTRNDVIVGLTAAGIPLARVQAMDDTSLNELAALSEIVRITTFAIPAFNTEAQVVAVLQRKADAKNRLTISRLRREGPYQAIAKRYPGQADWFLSLLIRHHKTGAALADEFKLMADVNTANVAVGNTDLAGYKGGLITAGMPKRFVDRMPEAAIYELEKVRLLVQAGAFDQTANAGAPATNGRLMTEIATTVCYRSAAALIGGARTAQATGEFLGHYFPNATLPARTGAQTNLENVTANRDRRSYENALVGMGIPRVLLETEPFNVIDGLVTLAHDVHGRAFVAATTNAEKQQNGVLFQAVLTANNWVMDALIERGKSSLLPWL